MLNATNLDLKIYWIEKLLSVSMEEFSYIIYPRIYEVTDIGTENATFGFEDENTGYMIKPYST